MAVVFDSDGNELEPTKVTNTKTGAIKFFKPYRSAQVAIGAIGAIGASNHSPWISRLLNEMGLTVYVENGSSSKECGWKYDGRDLLVRTKG